MVKLVVNSYHHGSCLNDSICFFADLQIQLLDGIHGDGGRNDVAASDINLNDPVDRSLGDADNGSFNGLCSGRNGRLHR